MPVGGCWDELEPAAYNSSVVCGDNGGTARFVLRSPAALNVHVWVRSRSNAESHAVVISCNAVKKHEMLVMGGDWHWTRLGPDTPLSLAPGDNEFRIHYTSQYGNELKVDLLSVTPEGAKPYLPLNEKEHKS